MSSPVGIYLSVPFCKAKCSFCNFASDAYGTHRLEGYVDRLCREMAGARERAGQMGVELPGRADSVYLGGGTPSLLSAMQLQKIFVALRGEFEIDPNAEITLECAPGQLAEETLEELLRQGGNRVSLGVQSFVDREAQAVGRTHTRETCLEEIARLQRAGVRDVGMDLIAGLPHQTRASWEESLECAIVSGVTHASVYLLEVDEDSRLGREVMAGGERYGAGRVPGEDEAAELYEMACGALDAGGLGQYEISNFAREGHRSRHNLKYWRRQPYLGLGLDAHSMLRAGAGEVRFQNTDDLETYMNDGSGPLALLREEPAAEWIDREAAFEESMFLGLRVVEGVSLRVLREEFGRERVEAVRPSVEEVCEAGLLVVEGDWIRLTARGRMASNEVFSRLLEDGLPAGPVTLGHPTNEDLFVGTPVRAVTS